MKPQIFGQTRQLFRLMAGLLFGMTLMWLAGCASGDAVPRALEADYGRSYTNNRLEMMVTPPNSVDSKPPVGMPPVAAKNAQDRYDKSFKEKDEPRTIRWLFQ